MQMSLGEMLSKEISVLIRVLNSTSTVSKLCRFLVRVRPIFPDENLVCVFARLRICVDESVMRSLNRQVRQLRSKVSSMH